MTNLSAVAANLKKETKLPSSDDSEETFEMKYNRACYLLAQGRWEEAEKVKATPKPVLTPQSLYFSVTRCPTKIVSLQTVLLF